MSERTEPRFLDLDGLALAGELVARRWIIEERELEVRRDYQRCGGGRRRAAHRSQAE